MNKTVKNILLLLVVISVVYFGNRTIQSHLGEQALEALPYEVHTLQDGLAKARAENKLILADYSAIWCPSCRKLDTQVFSNTEVASTIQNNFVYARLDFDSEEGQNFAQKFNLTGFPRVLVLDVDGNKIVEMPLVFDPSAYNTNLNKVLSMAVN
ncbi:thioredoxin family protein [Agaribacter flavus]|uniref:Thioredoxin family protein n=1 Tax=Agaribacter flavus TaxID=1902781 RepID=A0ABV7FT41_9ALTE